MIIVRKARTEDLQTLLGFEQGVIQAETPFDPTMRRDPIHYYDIAKMIDATDVEVVVAENGSELVGSGYARIEKAKHYLQHKLYCYLGFMYVKPEYRGHGVNQMIIDALQEWTISKGIYEMRLDVYSENENAIRAYKKAGFSPYMLCMRLGLTKESGGKK